MELFLGTPDWIRTSELADIINNPENLQGYTTAERNNRKSDNSASEMSEQDKNKHWEKANNRAEEFCDQKEKEGEERLIREHSITEIIQGTMETYRIIEQVGRQLPQWKCAAPYPQAGRKKLDSEVL